MKKYYEEFVKFLKEVRVEMSKVTWPTWLELKGSTVLVMLVSVFFAAYIFFVDLIITQITKLF
jgi:preprotein translocase subunit SecE